MCVCVDEREAVQKKTFTKWVNSHLGRVTCRISDLYTDLRDGRMLIRLLEVLSSEQLVSTSILAHSLPHFFIRLLIHSMSACTHTDPTLLFISQIGHMTCEAWNRICSSICLSIHRFVQLGLFLILLLFIYFVFYSLARPAKTHQGSDEDPLSGERG